MFCLFLVAAIAASSNASLLDDWGCLSDTIALRTHHGKYVVAESNGDVNADRNIALSYETFTVKELGGNKIALKSHHGKYMVAEEKSWYCAWCDWEVNADRNGIGDYEKFQVEKQSGGKIALKTHHGKYVVAEDNNELNADRTKVGSWEKFTPECKDPIQYLDKCVAACKKTACQSESDVKNGCSQMYSCVHACKIRHLGVKEDQCRKHCDRNGGSGCSPVVNGYQFALCGSCSRNGCSRWPSVAECEIGCATYGKEPISYKWASWGQWSSCTKTCGGKGTVQRTRKCIPPKWGGNECPSNTQTQTKDCDTDPCPVNCIWNDWQIGECSKTCAGGTRINTRTKKVQEANGGTCIGDENVKEICNTQKCPPIHCVWEDWMIGTCSKTCGTGTRTNTRIKLVEEANGGTCSGQPTEIEECNTQPCPVDCEWDKWEIGLCSKTCGGGLRTNSREERINAKHGGAECSGSAIVEESCNTQECPVDCEWGEWELGDCSKSCGGGIRLNYREKTVHEMFGGKCEGYPTFEEHCSPQNCPVDCEWGEWQIGVCSVSCGGGTQISTRSKLMEEKFGGVCIGDDILIENCNMENCPPIHCEWDDWILGECSKTCGTGTRINNRTKLVEEANGGTCDGQPSAIEECNPEPCPVDCVWGSWDIGECSKSCGGGIQTNIRKPNITAAHGGEECSGSASVTESCNTQECPVNCIWGEWTDGNCSVPCGGGYQINFREKLVSEMYGGECEGDSETEEECNMHMCPVDCEWRDWQYGECTKTCGGGMRTNTRSKRIEESFGGVCIGESIANEECNTQNCPAIHCEWDEWEIGECSKTCGTGIRTNTRSKLVVEEHGGTCSGEPIEYEECSTVECPVDCEWDDWQIGECSEECGGGVRTNTRTPKVEADHGGKECQGSFSITESCNVHECPVDCQWGNWIHGECSKTCGGGVQTNQREKITEALFGGEECVGESTEEKECNVQECSSLIVTCPPENPYCPTYVHYYGRFCEDTPANQWFIGEESRYACRKSCGLC